VTPALGGQGGHKPTLKIIWVGIAHPKSNDVLLPTQNTIQGGQILK